jgi:2-oxoglutarate dehydrogenase E1 component
LERFLQLAAEQNMQVVIPSTPAQYFHCLRRQALRRWKKPLVVLTPKSLLRHARNVSPLEECASGKFQRVIPDCRSTSANETRRILLSSGKVYYDLLQACEDRRRTDVALIRIEQFYPFPMDPLAEALAAYAEGTSAYWVQKEPSNMGALGYLRQVLGDSVLKRFPLAMISRRASASPASGSASAYQLEERELLARALDEPGSKQKNQPQTEDPDTDGRQKSRSPSPGGGAWM